MTEKTIEVKVSSVYIFPNGMVAVFDSKGEQVPELQGEWTEKAKQIYAVSDADTTISYIGR